MPAKKRFKTRYTGVYYIEGRALGARKKERIYYIIYRCNGKNIEEKVGRQFQDAMTPAWARDIRLQRIEGKKKLPMEFSQGTEGMPLSMEERLQFETLISELSAKFINLPVDLIDDDIENGLKRVCEALGLHRSLFLEFSKEKKLLITTHAWSPPAIDKPYPLALTREYAYLAGSVLKGEVVSFSDPDDLPEEEADLRQYVRAFGAMSGLALPLKVGENIMGMITWESHGIRREWSKVLVDRLRLIAEIFANALSRKRSEEALRALKDQLQAENFYLLDEIKLEHSHNKILGQSDAIKKVLNQVENVAGTNTTVLIMGETGTGKEVAARAIHDLSPRKERAIVKVNCSALPAPLIESELFGYAKGAFSGADTSKEGRFGVAHGSTLFLDEIGDLPLELQPKLLRVLQEGAFERLGSSLTTSVDVRVIAATNRDLARLVKEGRFRSDLYYRLNIYPISVPPLRDRPEDIPLLVRGFVRQFCDLMDKAIDTVPAESLAALQRYDWPGNIRELRNLVERAMILSKGTVLQIEPPAATEPEMHPVMSMDEMQRKHILSVLKRTGGRIFGDRGAAKLLSMNPDTLRSRMKRLGIDRMRGVL
ncbi:MAG: sigma 54-interacting transcriptional regulator [Desulfatitalea sp.]|nr:sigma 54-interacting transcriptional regulator [Desulfatitalea sp.]